MAYADGQTWYYLTCLDYDKMGWVWRKRKFAEPPGTDREAVPAWEFRYGGDRQRYLTRELDPETLQPIAGGDTWSDYLGDSIYADYTVDSGNVTMTKRYMAGKWQTDLTPLGDTPPGDPETLFFHNNALGTARLLSDDDGEMSGGSARLYTAFGDWVNRGAEFSHADTRYGYAGAWGYQPLKGGDSNYSGLMHVGARTYDPELGRWLQRDPIGIAGGLNVYAYVGNSPLVSVDPTGLAHGFDEPNEWWPAPFEPGWLRPDPWEQMYGGFPPPWKRIPQKGDPVERPPSAPRNWDPYPNGRPPGPGRELEEIKKDIWTCDAVGGLGSAIGKTPVFFIAVACASIIDQVRYYDEPLNPAYGGSYDNWHK